MAGNLTPEQFQEFESAFRMFDKSGQGFITTKDLKDALKKLGHNLSKKDLKIIIQKVDSDGNGKIDKTEFMTMMSTAVKRTDNEQAVRDSFRVFDRDGNGLITKKELSEVMATLGEKLTEEEVSDMIKEADSDGDGQINYEEFVTMMFGK